MELKKGRKKRPVSNPYLQELSKPEAAPFQYARPCPRCNAQFALGASTEANSASRIVFRADERNWNWVIVTSTHRILHGRLSYHKKKTVRTQDSRVYIYVCTQSNTKQNTQSARSSAVSVCSPIYFAAIRRSHRSVHQRTNLGSSRALHVRPCLRPFHLGVSKRPSRHRRRAGL